MLDKFKDDQMVTVGQKLIINEAAEILPKEMHKKIKRKIAERILSTNKEKWTTIEDFHLDWINLYENDDKMFSFSNKDEKLKFLEGIKENVDNLEQTYQDA